MRKTTLALGLVAAVAAWPVAHAATVAFKTNLGGANEVPPVNSKGSGSATVTLDTATKQATWKVEYTGLGGPAAAAHIHCGAPAGGNAGVAVNLVPSGTPATPIQGSGAMTDAQIAQLEAGQCYINIHTAENKGGELRGQLGK